MVLGKPSDVLVVHESEKAEKLWCMTILAYLSDFLKVKKKEYQQSCFMSN
jgi:hypothetical protein